jgi:hypothetical protein
MLAFSLLNKDREGEPRKQLGVPTLRLSNGLG